MPRLKIWDAAASTWRYLGGDHARSHDHSAAADGQDIAPVTATIGTVKLGTGGTGILRVDGIGSHPVLALYRPGEFVGAVLDRINGLRFGDAASQPDTRLRRIGATALGIDDGAGGALSLIEIEGNQITLTGAADALLRLISAVSPNHAALSLREAGDTDDRVGLGSDGHLRAGPGNAATDTDFWRAAVGTWATTNLLRLGGNAFPGSPATNDLFYRTDFGMWFFYDGTRWLSATLYDSPLHLEPVPAWPYNATTLGGLRGAIPSPSASIYIETFYLGFQVASGGTALDASNKWVCTLLTHPSATTIGTVTIDSGAVATYREGSAAVNAVVASTEVTIRTDATKTGTPGTLLIWPRFTYRAIAT